MPFVASAWSRPSYAYTAEDYIADLDRFGISYGVIAAASLFGTYNDYAIRALRRHDRLRGTAILDPAIDFYTLEAMRADGIVGARLQWFNLDPLPDMASDEFRRMCHRLRDLNMHIHLNIDGQRLTGVMRALLGLGVNLVIDHYGWHDPEERLEAESYCDMLRLVDKGDVWVKLSSGFRRPDRDLPAEYTQDLLRRFGPERLLWGSDSPFVGHETGTSYSEVVADFHYAVPDAATREALGASAYKFYFSE